MQDYVKKYFWVLAVLVIMVCAVLTAKAAGHLIEGAFLTDDAKPAKVDKTAKRAVANRATPRRSKLGAPLADRNMFCTDCEPEEPTEAPVGDPSDPNAVPFTSLPLKLLATNVSTIEKYSFATIHNTDSDSQGAYWVGDTIKGAGEVVLVAGKYVDFRNESTKRLERVSLLGGAPARPKPAAKSPLASKRKPKNELAAAIDEGINKVGENKYEVDRGLVEKLLANPMSVARGARIVPSVKNGKPNGFKLYAIRPSSVYAKLGFRNGDTINGVNGYELGSADQALEVYTKLKEASNLSVSVTRRGKAVTVDYNIR